VEGAKGAARVERLMNVELMHGFRSSFNFVPEGEYRVDGATRDKLARNGFEVGVHGLKHDGRLYSSKKKFESNATRIREYLDSWKASGFRSPLMQHNLPWLHALNVEYDASTFDTDPFEPEGDGVGTIFPFWVPGTNESGYVELPYTLAQDFTLFVTLREPNIDIWKQKLDWIANLGGMVLLNTHPDYMCFDGRQGRDEYPVRHYEELLRYVREKYANKYWAQLPRDVARYYTDTLSPASRNTRRKICMLAYTNYEVDNRVRRYAETLAQRGDQVDVIALAGIGFDQPVEELNGVTVYRIQHRSFKERHELSYAWKLMRFLLLASCFLTRLHERTRYDVVHVHNMPDFLVFAAWYPKLTGAKLILDVHDLVPELFANKFNTRLRAAYVPLLKICERMSARFVDHVIVSNHLWREKLAARSVSKNNCSVVVNHVDPTIFYPRQRTRNDGRFIIVFPGSFQWHQGLDIALRALVEVRKLVPNAELHLYGTGGGDQGTKLKQLAEQLGVGENVKFCAPVPLDQIPDVIVNADLGIVPKRADSFGNEAYSTKIMEFMSQGIPVVASQTRIDRYYFAEGEVHFFESGNAQAMANAILDVITRKELRESLVRRGFEYVELNSWGRRKKEYVDLIDDLATERFPSTITAASEAVPLVRQ
jgi:glycosyltransferase involved in cell wall biosynthesis